MGRVTMINYNFALNLIGALYIISFWVFLEYISLGDG
jgi:hypothetical protein